VGLSVGIIVFEGGCHLTVERVREASREALGLVTVGALVVFAGNHLTLVCETNTAMQSARRVLQGE